jgi:hypothetical protein
VAEKLPSLADLIQIRFPLDGVDLAYNIPSCFFNALSSDPTPPPPQQRRAKRGSEVEVEVESDMEDSAAPKVFDMVSEPRTYNELFPASLLALYPSGALTLELPLTSFQTRASPATQTNQPSASRRDGEDDDAPAAGPYSSFLSNASASLAARGKEVFVRAFLCSHPDGDYDRVVFEVCFIPSDDCRVRVSERVESPRLSLACPQTQAEAAATCGADGVHADSSALRSTPLPANHALSRLGLPGGTLAKEKAARGSQVHPVFAGASPRANEVISNLINGRAVLNTPCEALCAVNALYSAADSLLVPDAADSPQPQVTGADTLEGEAYLRAALRCIPFRARASVYSDHGFAGEVHGVLPVNDDASLNVGGAKSSAGGSKDMAKYMDDRCDPSFRSADMELSCRSLLAWGTAPSYLCRAGRLSRHRRLLPEFSNLLKMNLLPEGPAYGGTQQHPVLEHAEGVLSRIYNGLAAVAEARGQFGNVIAYMSACVALAQDDMWTARYGYVLLAKAYFAVHNDSSTLHNLAMVEAHCNCVRPSYSLSLWQTLRSGLQTGDERISTLIEQAERIGALIPPLSPRNAPEAEWGHAWNRWREISEVVAYYLGLSLPARGTNLYIPRFAVWAQPLAHEGSVAALVSGSAVEETKGVDAAISFTTGSGEPVSLTAPKNALRWQAVSVGTSSVSSTKASLKHGSTSHQPTSAPAPEVLPWSTSTTAFLSQPLNELWKETAVAAAVAQTASPVEIAFIIGGYVPPVDSVVTASAKETSKDRGKAKRKGRTSSGVSVSDCIPSFSLSSCARAAPGHEHTAFPAVQLLNMTSSSWIVPTAISSGKQTELSKVAPLYFHTATLIGGRWIFVIGGTDGTIETRPSWVRGAARSAEAPSSGSLLVLDTWNLEWSKVDVPLKIAEDGDVLKRCGHTAVALRRNSGSPSTEIFVYGGTSAGGQAIFDPVGDIYDDMFCLSIYHGVAGKDGMMFDKTSFPGVLEAQMLAGFTDTSIKNPLEWTYMLSNIATYGELPAPRFGHTALLIDPLQVPWNSNPGGATGLGCQLAKAAEIAILQTTFKRKQTDSESSIADNYFSSKEHAAGLLRSPGPKMLVFGGMCTPAPLDSQCLTDLVVRVPTKYDGICLRYARLCASAPCVFYVMLA